MNDPSVYRPHLDTTFTVEAGTARVPLRLADVTDAFVAHGFLQFSLFFHGPVEQRLEQGVYEMRHDALGALSLFIVPVIGSNNARTLYQACFNVRAASSEETRLG